MKYSIENLKIKAKEHNGQLLSNEYLGINKHYLWQCEKGHTWSATWNNVFYKNQWCLKCQHKCPDISILQEYAKTKGGLLLSTVYKTSNDFYKWQCIKGHIWENSLAQIKQHDVWCQRCDCKGVPSIGRISDFAESKGGKLLSTKYVDNNKYLTWCCGFGHSWKAKWKNIFNGNWCPFCNIENRRWNISEIQSQIDNTHPGSKLLSTSYVKAGDLLEWQCENGHTWKSTFNNILSGKWCLECARFKTEKMCKQILEDKFGFVFKKARFYYNKPKFYEFDGYNEEHKIAFEYHGYQHYIFPNYFHKTKEHFLSNQQRDRDKEQYCKENNIKLIIIPYTIKDLTSFITTSNL